jgi:predicted RNase H-related nuclease YkuK (DUF458 family)
MIHASYNSTQFVYLTLTEKQTLTNPNYIFRFIHRTTKEEKKILITTDYSQYKYRYNKLQLHIHQGFSALGEWLYYIYETNDNNTDIVNKNMLEQGIMVVTDGNFTYTSRNSNLNYVTR